MKTWNAAAYDTSFGFVAALGADLVDLLDPSPGDTVLDLGCGTGALFDPLLARGATVVGLDADATMVARARERHPGTDVRLADAHGFTLEHPVDAVLSNAALHWMPRPDAVLASVASALKPGGRLVAEMGGAGNVAAVIAALRAARVESGLPPASSPWYFPSPAEQATRLEAAGFVVRSLAFFDRPTPLDEGGVDRWLRMFADPMLADVAQDRRDGLVGAAVEHARPTLCREGRWFADYVRLRFVAERRPGPTPRPPTSSAAGPADGQTQAAAGVRNVPLNEYQPLTPRLGDCR